MNTKLVKLRRPLRCATMAQWPSFSVFVNCAPALTALRRAEVITEAGGRETTTLAKNTTLYDLNIYFDFHE